MNTTMSNNLLSNSTRDFRNQSQQQPQQQQQQQQQPQQQIILKHECVSIVHGYFLFFKR